jgi:hypothetical protein
MPGGYELLAALASARCISCRCPTRSRPFRLANGFTKGLLHRAADGAQAASKNRNLEPQ